MKKGKLIVIVIFLCVVTVYGAGLMRKSYGEQPDSTEETVSTQAAETKSQHDLEEEMFMKSVAADQEKVENGNIFSMGDYEVFGQFGYKVVDFRIYDSLEEFKQSDKFNEKAYDNFMQEGEASYIYVEIEVTSDAAFANLTYYNPIDIWLAKDGNTDIWENDEIHFESGGRAAYIDGMKDADSEYANRVNSEFEPGETLLMKYCFECCCIDRETREHIRIEDAVEDPEYYVSVEGELSWNTVNRIRELKDDRYHIYFKCEPNYSEQEKNE